MSTLSGKNAIVTGGSQGLGRAIVAELLRQGAGVVFCARTRADVEAAAAELASSAPPGARVYGEVADVSQACDCQDLVEAAITRLGHVDILVNNAGVGGPIGLAETVDWAEWQRTIEVNLFGVMHLCRALIPHLRTRGAGGRIINLSGGGATNPMPRFSAYAASKAALVRLTETLALELAPERITVNAIAPGAMNTRMVQRVVEAGPELAGEDTFAKNRRWTEEGGTPPELAARLCAYLAGDAAAGITGRLISAQWDPWESLHEHVEDLAGSDVYTLRRITPVERGFGWDPKAGK